MGSARQHYHDVCGLTSAYIVKRDAPGWTSFRHTRLLVFDGRDPGKQPDRADGGKDLLKSGKCCDTATSYGYRCAGSAPS